MTRRTRALEGLDRDLHDHVERETQVGGERGLSPEEARRQSLTCARTSRTGDPGV